MYDLSLTEQTERAKSAIDEALGLFKGAQQAPPMEASRPPAPSPGEPPPVAPPAPGAAARPMGQAQGTPFQGAASNPALRQHQGAMGSLGAALGQPPVKAGGPLMPGFAKGGLVNLAARI